MIWPTVALGEVATVERRGIQPADIARDAWYVGLEHIEPGGRTVTRQQAAGAELKSAKFQFGPEHILYGKLRPYLAKIATPDFSGVCSTDILPVRPGALINRRYLTHYLRQGEVVDLANSRATGANLPRLSPAELSKLPVPLPPLDEQRRISAILDQADAIRIKRRRVSESMQQLSQIILQQEWSFNGGVWESITFGDVVPTIEGGVSPRCLARPAAAGEWGVLKLSAVSYGHFIASENKAFDGDPAALKEVEVQAGDVLMSRKNTKELVGAVVQVGEVRPRLLLPDLIFRLHIDKQLADPHFFSVLLMAPWCRRRIVSLAGGSASSMSNIARSRLSTMMLKLPTLEVQQAISKKVRAAEQQRQLITKAAARDDALFASLQARAFKGEL